ncbi:sulfite exporter TauE/SafE family protein [Virgibacillus sp. NKC19-3]|uniref:sulfite exporter TauE/SafE family protein n=1 Tax=Virgibacillus saliphilus TaxID=2831674 RepID=UPI001C9A69DC|nr:sulfite exporter TauE/SafE family protein [Virgibacillus sp. NKC19-3]MBY7144884.1 sulfite exporter TauE/SafE family protein [Virgibacillus sp. NKC19-3]
MFIILFASILQTSTGFGFSIVATPFLLMLFEPREAVQINLILSLVISIALIMKIRKDVDMGVLKRFVFGSIAGLPLGISIFLFLDMTLLKFGISILILVLTLLLILRFRINQTGKRDFAVGGFSGALTTSIGMPGPPLLLYFSGTNTTKEKLRGTTLAFYLFVYFVSLGFQVVFAGTSREIWMSSLAGLPLVVIGLILGQLMFTWINQRLFQWLTYVLLLFSGVYLLLQQI